jgi:hypothetical protein
MTVDQRLLRFAQAYSAESSSNLTAYVALFRLEALLADAHAFKASLAPNMTGDEANQWSVLEIISYYSVGFVTCLEWHARARLVDLFRYNPSFIQNDDFNTKMNSQSLARMVSQRVPLPELLGGMKSVANEAAYLGIFARIFESLGIGEKPWDILRDIVIKRIHVTDGKTVTENFLEELFTFRNHLVHEIDSAIVGKPWQRNTKNINDVIADGKCVVDIIRTLEGRLSRKAPERFPNLLDHEGLPKGEGLEDQIRTLEGELKNTLGYNENSQRWDEAVSAAEKSIELHDEAIARAPLLEGTLYARLRQTLHLANRRRHLEFLLFVKEHVQRWEMGA